MSTEKKGVWMWYDQDCNEFMQLSENENEIIEEHNNENECIKKKLHFSDAFSLEIDYKNGELKRSYSFFHPESIRLPTTYKIKRFNEYDIIGGETLNTNKHENELLNNLLKDLKHNKFDHNNKDNFLPFILVNKENINENYVAIKQELKKINNDVLQNKYLLQIIYEYLCEFSTENFLLMLANSLNLNNNSWKYFPSMSSKHFWRAIVQETYKLHNDTLFIYEYLDVKEYFIAKKNIESVNKYRI